MRAQPALVDNDGDGLTDYEEIFIRATDPTMPDTDLDGLSDYAEIMLGTNPLLRDTDNDGLVDGSDPDPLAATDLTDSDNDGIPDAYEVWRFGDTNVTDTLLADLSGNGFLLATEFAAGLDPTQPPEPPNWITNVNGSPQEIRLHKISRLDNTLSDHTYSFIDNHASGTWVALVPYNLTTAIKNKLFWGLIRCDRGNRRNRIRARYKHKRGLKTQDAGRALFHSPG